jgi:hypothetical protein
MGFARITMATAVLVAALLNAATVAAQDTASPKAGQAAAPSTAAPPAVKPVEGNPPPSVTVIEAYDAQSILGRDVRSAADENMGRIADVIVDRGGMVRAAVIDFGGFLGVGSRKIAVDWTALAFSNVANKSESIKLELTREQVRAAPEYKDNKPIVVLGASGILEELRFSPPPQEK